MSKERSLTLTSVGVQTRMQVFATNQAAIYTGVGNAFSRISSTEGLRALWRGVNSVILGAGPAHAVHFGVYEAVKEVTGGNRGGNQFLSTCEQDIEIYEQCGLTEVDVALAGAAATIASDALMNPFDGELTDSVLAQTTCINSLLISYQTTNAAT